MTATRLELIRIGKNEPQEIADYIAHHPHGMLYHTAQYRALLAELLSCGSLMAVAYSGSAIAGVLPFMAKSSPHGAVLNSLPFYGSHGGVLAQSPSVADALVQFLLHHAQSTQAAALTLISNPFFPDMLAGLTPHFSDERLGQWTPLPHEGDDEAFLQSLDSNTRRDIRKCIRMGVTVERENSMFPFLYQTHLQNMQEIGGRAKSEAFFQLVQQHFQPEKDFDIFVSRVADEPAAAVLVFYSHGFAEYYTPVTLDSFRQYMPLTIALFRAMCHARSKGCTIWNWGGTWATQDGVRRFKDKWSTFQKNYRYYTWVYNRSLLQMTPDALIAEYGNFYVVPFSALAP